jgi:putative ABC transport system substrate-binding protein
LELLHELVPGAANIALLINPTNPNAVPLRRDVQAAASTLGLQVHAFDARTDDDLALAFNAMRPKAGAVLIGPDPFFNTRSAQIAALTISHTLPTIYQYHEFVAAGGLMSYGGSLSDSHRQVGIYTGRILKGEKPANLPVEQITKVELILDLKTARALALEVPPTLLARADEVIE